MLTGTWLTATASDILLNHFLRLKYSFYLLNKSTWATRILKTHVNFFHLWLSSVYYQQLEILCHCPVQCFPFAVLVWWNAFMFISIFDVIGILVSSVYFVSMVLCLSRKRYSSEISIVLFPFIWESVVWYSFQDVFHLLQWFRFRCMRIVFCLTKRIASTVDLHCNHSYILWLNYLFRCCAAVSSLRLFSVSSLFSALQNLFFFSCI